MFGLPRGADDLDKELYGPEAHAVTYSIHKYKRRRTVRISSNIDITIRTTNLARYLMERHLKKRLAPDEDVHHIDGNQLNDELNNFQVIKESEHISNHHKEKHNKVILICVVCEKSFEVIKSKALIRSTCSRKCRFIRHKTINRKGVR